MSTALALTTPHLSLLAPRSASKELSAEADTLVKARGVAQRRPVYVYGDSTPFPQDCDFIEAIYSGVEHCVALMRAQHAINLASARAGEVDQRRISERGVLLGMVGAIRRAIVDSAPVAEQAGAARVARVSACIEQAASAAIESELSACDVHAKAEVAKTTIAQQEAKTAARNAVEAFARARDLPGTAISLRLVARARAEGYDAQALVTTPYRLDAVFDVAIPAEHGWAKVRRVADLTDALVLCVPREAGWFSGRKELARLKLSKWLVRNVLWAPEACRMTLAKGHAGQDECELSLDPRSAPPRALFRNAGTPGSQPFELAGEDAAAVRRLYDGIVSSTRDLPSKRKAMTQALFDGKTLATHAPQAVANAILEALAPTTAEIARRSGAPGELVLRRDAGTRRRDEIYVTKAELMEWIRTLPPAMRSTFDRLDLAGPRSPRAPAPSLPAYEEIGESDILVTVRRLLAKSPGPTRSS